MKLSKKVIAIALASTMAITPAGNVLHTFGIHTEATTMAASTISTYDQLVAACAKSGTYTLTKSIKCTKPVSVTANVTIKSTTEDNIIYAGSEMSQVFYVDGGTLNLGETGDSARTAVRGGTTDTAYTTKAVVTVDNGGTLNVNAAHIYRSNGNGIRVQGKSKCTMNNGSINGLKPFKSIGGAVYVLEESTFNLKSGSITGNTCGGVTVNKGSIFNMTGGTIATNTGGGGDPTSSDSKTGYGGGVYLAGTFKMSGGVIKSNTASYGKGVYIVDNANMYVSGDMLVDSSENDGNDVRLQSKDANIILEGNLSNSPAMRVTLPENTPGTVVAKAANSLMDISSFITNQNFVVSNQGDFFIAKSTDGLSLILSKNCRITYNAMGGSTTTTTQDCQWGAVATVASAPSRVGYSFIGWNTDVNGNGTNYSANASITVQEDTTLYAQWSENDVVVNYNANGGNNAPSSATEKYSKGVAVTYEVPTRDGYEFIGWNTKADGTGNTYKAGNIIQENITLYAQWKQTIITVQYSHNDGTNRQNKIVTADATNGITINYEPERTGYRFVGWNTAQNGTGMTYDIGNTIKENVILYAQWEKIVYYTVTYDADGGNFSGNISQRYENGSKITIPAEEPKKTGYVFYGWNTQKDGSGVSYSAGSSFNVDSDITLYAQWKKIVYYTVTYDTDGGYFSGNANQKYETGSKITIPMEEPKRTGYIFTGWNTQKDGSGVPYSVGSSFNIDSNVTLYAQWTEDTSDTNTVVIEQYAPVLKASVSGVYVTLTWAFTGEITGYEVEVNSAATKNKYKKVATVTETNSSYIDSALKQGKNAKIRVRAYIIVGGKTYYSKYSNVETKTVLKKASLKAVRYAKKTKKATIQWLAPTGLSGIEIYQKIGTGKYKKIYTAKGTSKKIVVSLAKVKKGKKVSYKIRYYKKSGNTKVYSMYSNVKTIKR